jgi:hypothetical protein
VTYNVKHHIDIYGIENVKDLIYNEGLTQIQLHQAIGLSASNSRLNSAVYKRIYAYLGIPGLPYSEDKQEIRKFKLEFDKVEGNYWESEYISEYLILKLQHPTLNIAEGSKRYVINFPKHPKANPTSNQIKAHIVQWELVNEQYVPEDCWVVPIDNDYTNLDLSNWVLVNTRIFKHNKFVGANNPAYKHGLALRPKQGGWSQLSKKWLNTNPTCKICNATRDLVVHHIINYHLFTGNFTEANKEVNLLTLCRGCHTSLHAFNTSIKAHIEETQYSKLLELLETLKSQVPDTLIEIYRDVEKQLGLTDNQQPSTV